MQTMITPAPNHSGSSSELLWLQASSDVLFRTRSVVEGHACVDQGDDYVPESMAASAGLHRSLAATATCSSQSDQCTVYLFYSGVLQHIMLGLIFDPLRDLRLLA